MWPVFRSAMFTYQSKANLDVEILFGKITHLLDLKAKNTGKFYSTANQTFHLLLLHPVYIKN